MSAAQSSSPRPRGITSPALWQAFVEAGIFRRDDHIRQFVIVAREQEPVRMYVEHYGDERMLRVATALSGIEITNVEAPPDDEGFREDNPDNEREKRGTGNR